MAEVCGTGCWRAWLNLGASGQSVLTWCSNSTYGKVQMEAEGNKCQAYIIGLGVNDSSNSDRAVPLGSPSDIVDDPDTVATTYYGGILLKSATDPLGIYAVRDFTRDNDGKTYYEVIKYAYISKYDAYAADYNYFKGLINLFMPCIKAIIDVSNRYKSLAFNMLIKRFSDALEITD